MAEEKLEELIKEVKDLKEKLTKPKSVAVFNDKRR